MKSRGSLMKFKPAFMSWPTPPLPVRCHEKSSRNCHFFCSVVCGVFGLWPICTPLGNWRNGSWLRAVMLLAKSAYWKMNSFSMLLPITQFSLRLIELNSLVESPQLLGARLAAALYGWLFSFRP